MADETTPLWLDLRTEYIDDNFDKLVDYLHNNSGNKDDKFYHTTLDLLEQRVVLLISELADRNLYDEPESREETLKQVRLLAVYLLSLGTGNAEAFIAFMKLLATLHPKHAKQLLNKSIERLRNGECLELGFAWNDYDIIEQELFTVNLINHIKFGGPIATDKCVNHKGTILLDQNGIHLSSASYKDIKALTAKGNAQSLNTGVGIDVVTKAGNKLKQSQEGDLKAIEEFAKNLKLDLQNFRLAVAETRKHNYSNGDDVLVVVTGKGYKAVFVRTIDVKYNTIEGQIVINRPSINYYKKESLLDFMEVGDVMAATVEDVDSGKFDIEKQFAEFILDDCRENGINEEFLAECVRRDQYNLIWINELGHPVKTPLDDRCDVGSKAIIRVNYIKDSNKSILGDVVELSSKSDFNPLEKQKECFKYFVSDCSNEVIETTESNQPEALSTIIVNLLLKFVFDYQKTLRKPSERYRNLSLAALLATAIDDQNTVDYIEFAKSYLRALVAFVNEEPVGELTMPSSAPFASAKSTMLRTHIIDLLQEYGKSDDSRTLADGIDSDEETIAKLAKLIQSANRMKELRDKSSRLIPGVLSVIKHEILKTLSVESEQETDLEADSRDYVGMESATMEFKTSAIYETGKSDFVNEISQNAVIARTVCAFLNSKAGGTLYIGVNDEGYVTGIDNDLKWLNKNLDSYGRYIQDMLKLKLGTDAVYYTTIEPAYDGKVLMVHVQPHPYQVVELDGKAYVRINSESRLMPEDLRLELLSEKRKKDKEKAYNISWLQRAHQLRKCVVLHRYASSNGKVITDRHIEPYKILDQDDLVVGFDIDKHMSLVFNINRIDYVEMRENEDWGHTSLHHDIEVDAFHLSGDKPVTVEMTLDLLARNQLLEEFPRTKDCITDDANDPNRYYYKGEVRNILGIMRFYMGLAEHVTITRAPQEFKDRIKETAQKILNQDSLN